jgi:hypothetical protein
MKRDARLLYLRKVRAIVPKEFYFFPSSAVETMYECRRGLDGATRWLRGYRDSYESLKRAGNGRSILRPLR